MTPTYAPKAEPPWVGWILGAIEAAFAISVFVLMWIVIFWLVFSHIA